MKTGFKDMHGDELFVGNIIESVSFGTRLKIIRDEERKCFGGDYYPTKEKPNGYGVWNIKSLDFSDYFKVNKEEKTMSNLERLLDNMKLFLEVGGEEYTRNVFQSLLEGDKQIDSINELNELMETEISYWEE